MISASSLKRKRASEGAEETRERRERCAKLGTLVHATLAKAFMGEFAPAKVDSDPRPFAYMDESQLVLEIAAKSLGSLRRALFSEWMAAHARERVWSPPEESTLLRILGVEKDFSFPHNGTEFGGTIDLIVEVAGRVIAIDHKTISNLKYAHTPETLATDPQAIIYAHATGASEVWFSYVSTRYDYGESLIVKALPRSIDALLEDGAQ